jgi:lysophospholipase L1-like esterase
MIAKEEYLLDEVHPNIDGYRAMADVAKQVLASMG